MATNVNYNNYPSSTKFDILLEIAKNLNGEKVPSRIKRVSDAITRQANTDAYTAGDVITENPESVLEFDIFSENGKSGEILSANLITDGNNAGALGDFELFLFSTQVSITGDNEPMANPAADFGDFLGRITFASGDGLKTANNERVTYNGTIPNGKLGIVAASADTKIYGILVDNGGYVPVSAEIITINLNVKY